MVEPINKWKPVTEEYNSDSGPQSDAQLVDEQASTPNAQKKAASRAPMNMPLGAYLIAWYCFLRTEPDSILAKWLVGRAPGLVPITIRYTGGDSVGKMLSEAVFVMAIPYVVIGIVWLMRYWRIRGITILLAGASLVRTALSLMTLTSGGVVTSLSPPQKEVLLISSFFDLLIFLYLTLHKGVVRAFANPY
jgi:hypothetical protein